MSLFKLVSGSDAFLRDRQLQSYLKGQPFVSYIEGSSPGLEDLLNPGGFFTSQPDMKVVTSPEKVPLEVWKNRLNWEAPVVLYHDGEIRSNTKFHKFATSLGSDWTNFKKPSTWDEEGYATKFCVEEAKQLGKNLTLKLAGSLVKAAGTDLGRLSKELLKVSHLTGNPDLTVDHLKLSLCPNYEQSVFPTVNAVSLRDHKLFLKESTRLGKHSKDPTMWLCAVLGKQLLLWLQVEHMASKKTPTEQITAVVGVHAYRLEKEVVPAIKRWKKEGIRNLIRTIANTERSVKDGYPESWNLLQAELMTLILG